MKKVEEHISIRTLILCLILFIVLVLVLATNYWVKPNDETSLNKSIKQEVCKTGPADSGFFNC